MYTRDVFAEKLCRWLLAIVFLAAGVPKIVDIPNFAKIIEAYGLLPDYFLVPAALFLSMAEVAAGIGLLLHERAALHLAAGLLVLFITVLGYGIWTGLDIDCGCFSTSDPEYRAFSGLRLALLRDLLLLIPLFCLYRQTVLQKS